MDLAPDDQLTVQVSVQLPEEPLPVRVAGSVLLPSGWKDEERALDFFGVEETEMWMEETALPFPSLTDMGLDADARRWLAFEVQLPRPGTYGVEVKELYRTLLEVSSTGLDDVEILLPAPANVQVKVVDVANDEEVEVASLRWSLPHVEGFTSTYLYTAARDPDLGRVTFQAPAQEIHLSRPSTPSCPLTTPTTTR